jgi:putative transposase
MLLPFRGFDEAGELRNYVSGDLPHWRQSGCTYFVTFRLADSVPKALVDRWEEQRSVWLRKLGGSGDATAESLAKLPRLERRRFERHFAQLLNEYLDGCEGECLLRDPEVTQLVSEALYHFCPARVIVGDSVVMPNHVHALMCPNDADGFQLEDVLHSIKSFTSNAVNRLLGTPGRAVWQKHSYDHIVRDQEQLIAFQRYIRSNPVKAKLRPGEYVLREAEYELSIQ